MTFTVIYTDNATFRKPMNVGIIQESNATLATDPKFR